MSPHLCGTAGVLKSSAANGAMQCSEEVMCSALQMIFTCVLEELLVVVEDGGITTRSNDLGHGIACRQNAGHSSSSSSSSSSCC
jgi:hypothetical protein